MLLSVAVVVAVVIAAVYFLNTSGPAPVVAVTGKLPSNMTTIAESRPTISVEFTLQNINVDALSFSICLDGGAAAGMTKGASEAHFTPAYSLNDGVHNVSVNISSGSTLLSSVSWSFSVDASPPTITSLYPVNGTVYSEDLLLSVNFTDPTGVDLDRLTLLLDDVNITGSAQISQGGLFYTPRPGLAKGPITSQ